MTENLIKTWRKSHYSMLLLSQKWDYNCVKESVNKKHSFKQRTEKDYQAISVNSA